MENAQGRKRRNSDENNPSGPSKIPRINPPCSSDELQINMLQLTDLPMEVFERIISNIEYSAHGAVRSSSQHLKTLHDKFLWHRYMTDSAYYIRKYPNSYEGSIFKILKASTEAYLQMGYESAFISCLLPLYDNSLPGGHMLPPNLCKLNKFLQHFYNLVENQNGNGLAHSTRLLYTMTLLKILKAFKTCKIIQSKAHVMHWRIIVQLTGPWFGLIFANYNGGRYNLKKGRNLLTILCEMLFGQLNDKAFKRVLLDESEDVSELHVFGYTKGNTRRTPKTTLKFTVHGSRRVIMLLRKCIEGGCDADVPWPSKIPREHFMVVLETNCRAATQWGCPQTSIMEINPYQDTSDEED